ncbi:hypothetical protein AK830_g5963 [Neonectria ditissima]|uniref:C3H1-type domain-containing protein n=1 Tax=Neonectria ditissima TaxID=78410 RepID=A0A0P7BHZ5_9HYPO|nr:hypothetical protein AK830_g5963 [Neonectria ditissima]
MESPVCEEFNEFVDNVCAQGMKSLNWMATIQLQLQTFSEKHRNACRELERERAAKRDDKEKAERLESEVKGLRELACQNAYVRVHLEKEQRLSWYTKGLVTFLMSDVDNLKKAANHNAFVLVLIDADAEEYMFDEKYYQGDPAEGGKRAALDLRAAVQEHIRNTKPELVQVPIVVKAFASGHGLAESLAKNGLFTADNAKNGVFRFASGFSEADDQFDFVFVGVESSRGNHKIKSAIRQYVESPTCKHLLLGARPDNDYAQMLEKYLPNLEVVAKIELLKSFRTSPGLASLPFPIVTIGSLFRTGPVINLATTPAVLESSTQELAAWPKPGENGEWPRSFKEVVPTSTSPPVDSVARPRPMFTKQTSNEMAILLNANYERVDFRLPEPSKKTIASYERKIQIEGKRFCFGFYLMGPCISTKCQFLHTGLTAAEQVVQRIRFRWKMCPMRQLCRDPKCAFGHHCFCDQTWECEFLDELHHVDLDSWKEVTRY